MKIALLCRSPQLYSHQRLIAAARLRGHEIDPVNHIRCTLDIASARPRVHCNGRLLDGYDAVIPRIGASVTFYGTAVVRQFEMMGVYCVNPSIAISRSRDKLRSLQILARKGIGLPATVFAHRTSNPEEVVRLAGGAPVVVKLLEGTQGIGVVLGETERAAESIIEAFGGVNTNILVQEYVAEARGEDIRCIVIGGRVVASMIRRGKEGEFRSNLHRGGSARPARISPAERRTAIAAAKAMGLNVCGVDMLRAARGPLVLEVNSSPGLEGIEQATGVDVAGKIVEFIEKSAKQGRKRTGRTA
ncbi:30S ribosomal protein S6--L-glutamate ligase [Allosphingosinicella indica]|uniref:Probable alpha-L-glutamate ligase n=1 Tax=Allosphingosinicella indica TaxID=941907 RepID=A0A1X7G6T7_9SPHN|nr:30S ribosomal protein S6--L-glutamate ligase [Allosphingosinicella indica]SMF65033.1 ribosomal protein S6--L-glutamate ligase [Allosphingosinicella indica]